MELNSTAIYGAVVGFCTRALGDEIPRIASAINSIVPLPLTPVGVLGSDAETCLCIINYICKMVENDGALRNRLNSTVKISTSVAHTMLQAGIVT